MTSSMQKYILVAVLTCLAGAVVGGGAVAYYFFQKEKSSVLQEEKREVVTPSTPSTESDNKKKNPEEESEKEVRNVSWLPFPKKIDEDLKLIIDTVDTAEKGVITYFLTGRRDGMDIIVAEAEEMCMGTCKDYGFFEKRPNGYVFIARASSPDLFGEYSSFKLSEGVPIDRESGYADLRVPETFLYKDLEFRTYAGYGEIPEESYWSQKELEKISEFPYGMLYSHSADIADVEDLPGVTAQSFVLRKANGMAVDYSVDVGIMNDDMVLSATWADGSKNEDGYQAIATGGCGARADTPIRTGGSLDGLVATGTTPAGPVYEFANTNDPLLKKIYEAYQEMAAYREEEGGVPSYGAWLKKHPVVAFKDSLGRVLLYNNTRYGPAVECGKPVIYLYPQTPTDVSVAVGADITVSEPEYGNGWTVRAYPDGTLVTRDGVRYDSLFWEGLGHGLYPEVSSGFVVERAHIETTMRSHLRHLGLNEKEAADFLEFWLPRMPQTPYVRLTWFGTREMDTLAPLAVSPQPDTSIRIFLDFEGLEQKIDIPPQKLSSIPRRGFTLVEWGGLLRK